METGSDLRRRKWGLVCLAVPMGMLILGETALKPSLDGMAFLLYWFCCLVFTFGAILIALADMRSVRRQTRAEARELLEKTLVEIERQAIKKSAEPD